MGNQQSNHDQKDYQQHPRLGTISITQSYNHHTHQTVEMMELQRSLHSQSLLNYWKAFIVKINDSEIREVLLLPNNYSFQKHGMCSTSGKLNVTFQYFPYNLTNQIGNRSGLNKYFEQKQIWYLLYNLIRAANKFERINKKIGNIHPDNVFINSIGQVKIFAACSLPGEKDNFQLMAQNYNNNAYLAPQQLANDAIKGSHYPSHMNPCLAQTFSIGLTVLTAGTLLQCQNLYQRHKSSLKFNQNALQSILGVFRQNYTQFLSNILQSILQINPKNRSSASEIYEQIYQYERQILNLQDFLSIKSKQYQKEQSNMAYSQTKKVTPSQLNNEPKVNNVNKVTNNQLQQQLKLNQMYETVKLQQAMFNTKHTNNMNQNLPPQMTETFSFHQAPATKTQKVIISPSVVINTQRIISSPVIRFQSPQQLPVQQSRSPPSIMPGPMNPVSHIRSQMSKSPIPNSKIVFQQTKILPPIRSMNSQINKNTLPVMSHIVKNVQNPQHKFINHQHKSPQNGQNQPKNSQQKVFSPISNQNISTIKTIPINSVIHANINSNKVINNLSSKPSFTGMFLPLQSVRVIDIKDNKSSPKIPVNTVHQSQDDLLDHQFNDNTENHREKKDQINQQTPQIQSKRSITQRQIPLDSKLISFQKIK